jgi:hypothetical protein
MGAVSDEVRTITHKCGRHRVRRLMRLMRLVPIYQVPNTSRKHAQHKIYPYLLRGMKIDRPTNQLRRTATPKFL